ncbi:hypothetical protein [Haliscomenobacter sp.]|jgi:hypothetical protein|uniref:hypothetical protein n=1 Tax=Haliscomenobacter sp. TaxID=2717303 RepID=UPI003364DB8F
MTLSASHQTVPAADLVGLRDPILQELWRVKAQLNAQANYSILEIVRRLNHRKTQSKLAGGIPTQG